MPESQDITILDFFEKKSIKDDKELANVQEKIFRNAQLAYGHGDNHDLGIYNALQNLQAKISRDDGQPISLTGLSENVLQTLRLMISPGVEPNPAIYDTKFPHALLEMLLNYEPSPAEVEIMESRENLIQTMKNETAAEREERFNKAK